MDSEKFVCPVWPQAVARRMFINWVSPGVDQTSPGIYAREIEVAARNEAEMKSPDTSDTMVDLISLDEPRVTSARSAGAPP